MLWFLTHLSWLEFQTQYRGYDPSSSRTTDLDADDAVKFKAREPFYCYHPQI